MTVRRNNEAWRLFFRVGGVAGTLLVQVIAFAAETSDPVAMSQTQIIVKVDAEAPLAIRTSFQEHPPTITIKFPGQRVVGSLPERSVISKGVIQTIAARYDRPLALGADSQRFIQSLRIELSAPYPFHVRSESGRIVVEIDHTAAVSATAVEIGLKGGTIIRGLGKNGVSERFRAMQEALANATPTPLTSPLTRGLPHSQTALMEPQSAVATPSATELPQSPSRPEPLPASGARAPAHSARIPSPFLRLVLLLSLAVAVAAAGFWVAPRAAELMAWIRGADAGGKITRLPSGLVLIDQLVWRAFERQGYQLVLETELTQPPIGTLRVIMKDGAKTTLLFVGHGPFFEKQTVEHYVRAMRHVNVDHGFLVAAGSFTVPAQRMAKEHEITLIGREQLIELLSSGAGSEYFTKQLEQGHARLEEAKETLRQYAAELDTLRRQRNEASWYLGEERAASAKLEAHLDELKQELQHHELEIQRWEREVSTVRKQWEESQWYLGESQVRVRYLEGQLATLQEIAKRVETAEHELTEADWYLGEERAKNDILNAQFAELQKHLEESAKRERALQDTLAQLKEEISVLRTYGDRRSHARAEVPQSFLELYNGEERPLFSGVPRDVSSTGVGLETEQELPAKLSFRIRLTFPGREPIESKGRLMWQQAGESSARYRSGCRLLGLSASTRALIEQLVWEFQSSHA